MLPRVTEPQPSPSAQKILLISTAALLAVLAVVGVSFYATVKAAYAEAQQLCAQTSVGSSIKDFKKRAVDSDFTLLDGTAHNDHRTLAMKKSFGVPTTYCSVTTEAETITAVRLASQP